MEKPPLTEAPLGWLKAVLEDRVNDPDETTIDFTIVCADDGQEYDFDYLLGEIRTELRKRTSN